MRIYTIASAALAVSVLLLCERSDFAGASTPPHIMFMVVDGEQTATSTGIALPVATMPALTAILDADLGWNDISWHNPQIRSPRIHALAEAGVKLVNHHTFKWCSPSRSSFMT